MTHAAVTTHYDTLLAPIYRWMVGDLATALERSREELQALGVAPARAGARGLDLGAGFGLQTLPLAQAGYAMTALDSSSELLRELGELCPEAQRIHGELGDLARLVRGPFALIVCMGDTLTHLESAEAARELLRAAAERLAPEGKLVLTFRDYTAPPREPAQRFILVRADDSRILTCHLDPRETQVLVTDVVHERQAEGWRMRASTYPKLRLPQSTVVEWLKAEGLRVVRASTDAGRIGIVADAQPGRVWPPRALTGLAAAC